MVLLAGEGRAVLGRFAGNFLTARSFGDSPVVVASGLATASPLTTIVLHTKYAERGQTQNGSHH